jgi:probable F420-dependent oxidoreductase
VRLGAQAPLLTTEGGREFLLALGETAESGPYESLWVGEHVVSFVESRSRYPYKAVSAAEQPKIRQVGLGEPMTALAFLAASTTTVGLGAGVVLLPQRNPVYVAKEAASVDVLSGGRLVIAFGIGWDREEMEALGASWEGRGARTDEYIEVVRRLWAGKEERFDGEHYRLPACSMEPKPVQSPMPVLIGGNSDPALRRVARIGDGWLAYDLVAEEFAERLALLRDETERVGRDPETLSLTLITGSAPVDQDAMQAFAAAGVQRLVVSVKVPDTEGAVAAMQEAAASYTAAGFGR